MEDGILHVNVVEGLFTTELFKGFIKGLLGVMQPYPGPSSVIVMDNCQIHKHEEIREMVEEKYVTLFLLSLCFILISGCYRGM